MKRRLSLHEIPPFKQFKEDTSSHSLVKSLKLPNILNTIIGYWFADRANVCPRCKQSNGDVHVVDRLGFQVITAFYRTDPPWQDFYIDSTLHEIWRRKRCLVGLNRYVVFTRHQRMYFKSWENPSLLKHMCNIVDRYKLRRIESRGCANLLMDNRRCTDPDHWTACRHLNWGLLSFAIDKGNLPLMRRILDLSMHCGMSFAQIIKTVESQTTPKSELSYPFLRAYANTVKIPRDLLETFECLKDHIFNVDASNAHFYRALAITFEERGLDLHFWMSAPELALEEDSDGEY